MRFTFIASAFAVSLSPALADDSPVDCDAVYERLKANAPGDVSVCELQVAEPKFDICTPPTAYSAERPASHVVLILDASGSMAGKSGGGTKMDVAKREALGFLSALQKDVPVGLMIYGHRGNNQESGKAESCAATEWAHKIGASKSALADSINDLQPTGWTPIGGALTYAKDEIAKLPPKKDDELSVPIVYLISDGEETCGGNPVAAAKVLHESGIRAAVNVIGFGVDAETRAQLEAISEAGGGRYFPAEDALALKKQMTAIRENAASRVWYRHCQLTNRGRVDMVHHAAAVQFGGCLRREGETNGISGMLKQIKTLNAVGGPEKACVADLKRRAYADHSAVNSIMVEQRKIMQAAREKAVADYEAQSSAKPTTE